jgi:hypothetical protein
MIFLLYQWSFKNFYHFYFVVETHRVWREWNCCSVVLIINSHEFALPFCGIHFRERLDEITIVRYSSRLSRYRTTFNRQPHSNLMLCTLSLGSLLVAAIERPYSKVWSSSPGCRSRPRAANIVKKHRHWSRDCHPIPARWPRLFISGLCQNQRTKASNGKWENFFKPLSTISTKTARIPTWKMRLRIATRLCDRCSYDLPETKSRYSRL